MRMTTEDIGKNLKLLDDLTNSHNITFLLPALINITKLAGKTHHQLLMPLHCSMSGYCLVVL